MTNWKLATGTAAFITLMGSTATFADVTAKEVWTDWRDYMSGFGYQISASEDVSDAEVNISDLSMTMDLPEDGGKIKVDIGAIGFKDRGDGTVAIILPHEMPVSIDVSDKFSTTIHYGLSVLSVVVSGSPEDMTYTYSAPKILVGMSGIMLDGKQIDGVNLDLVLTGLAGQSNKKAGNLRQIAEQFSADSLSYDFTMDQSDVSDFAMSIKGKIADFTGFSEAALPNGANFTDDMAAALKAGLAVKGGLSWGANSYDLKTKNSGAEVTGSASADRGSLSVAMNERHIQYGGDAKGSVASFSSSALPFPIEFNMADSVFNLLVPVSKSDTPEDFALTIKLGDFTIGDALWGLFDPAGNLSRDPATILLDFNGKSSLNFDLMDPESAGKMAGGMPADLHSLTLKGLQIKAAGADLTGSGAFTFNNDDLQTFGGVPAPSGALDIKLVGGNGLMDNLVKMGLLPEEQAMGARMMMGMFAVAGDGEDTLTSTIEVTDEGHVLANGQRLK